MYISHFCQHLGPFIVIGHLTSSADLEKHLRIFPTMMRIFFCLVLGSLGIFGEKEGNTDNVT
jgi:hypothetical protein